MFLVGPYESSKEQFSSTSKIFLEHKRKELETLVSLFVGIFWQSPQLFTWGTWVNLIEHDVNVFWNKTVWRIWWDYTLAPELNMSELKELRGYSTSSSHFRNERIGTKLWKQHAWEQIACHLQSSHECDLVIIIFSVPFHRDGEYIFYHLFTFNP